jgi:serine/threonine protein kinase
VQFISSTTTLVERMHSKGYIHRDIQLGNVLVDRRGSPVLADPSLVSMDNGTGGRSDKVVVRTRQYWMAPESSSMFVCAATDVYGLGFLFIGLLLGNSSFKRDRTVLLVWPCQTRPSVQCVEAWEALCAWLNASRQCDLATRQLFAPLSLLKHILSVLSADDFNVTPTFQMSSKLVAAAEGINAASPAPSAPGVVPTGVALTPAVAAAAPSGVMTAAGVALPGADGAQPESYPMRCPCPSVNKRQEQEQGVVTSFDSTSGSFFGAANRMAVNPSLFAF